MKFSTQTLIAAMAAATLGGSAYAATVTYGGVAATDWEDGTSWALGTAPANDLVTDVAQFLGATGVDLSTARQVGGLDLVTGITTLSGTGSLEVGPLDEVSGLGGTIGSGDLIINVPIVTLRQNTVDAGAFPSAFNYTGDITVGLGSTLISERHAIRLDTSTNANTTITLDGGELAAAGGDFLDITGRDIALTANGGTIRHQHARNVFHDGLSVISGAGELTLANAIGASSSTAGRIQLQGTNTYTGGTNITNGGQAWVYSDASLGAVDTAVRMSDGGTYFAVNNVNLGNRAFTIEAGIQPENARINTSNKTTTINGAISGSGDLDVVGEGVLFVNSGSNTLTGAVNIAGTEVLDEFDNIIGYNAPAVRYGNTPGSLGSGIVTLDNQGELYASDNMDLSGNTSIVIGSGGGVIRQRHARNIFGLSGVVISGDGALTLDSEGTGVGRIQMEGTNTYTGGTIIKNNTVVRTNSNEALGDAAGSITLSGGILQNNNSNVDLGDRAIEVDADGGTIVVGWNNRRISHTGVISGVGQLTIANDSSSARLGGDANTYSGGTVVEGTLWARSLGTGDITLRSNSVNADRGHLKNLEDIANGGGNGTANITLANNIIVADIVDVLDGEGVPTGNTTGGGNLSAGWVSDFNIDGAISGTAPLNILADSGRVLLNGESTYSGLLTVQDGATLGGNGALDGDLTIDAGGQFAFSTTDTLDIAGTVTLDSTFGIDDLVGISSATSNGTYALIGETNSDFSFIENFGLANAFDLGDGVSAYFQNGSLEVVVSGGADFLEGDYNADGFVSQADLDLVLLNWGDATVPAEWLATEQFDGIQVSQNELDGVLLNWGNGTPPSGVAAVPEPASLALLGLGGAALATRRRRK